MKKRLTLVLAGLYFFPWGIQCLVDNFLPIYVVSLPFATERTVGEIAAIASVVTMVSQLMWTNIAGRSKNKSNVLALSLVFLFIFSLLFLLDINRPLLILFTVLFYSCYMTHQPLIDTIAAEKYSETNLSFGFFRSFASLGYAVFGLFYTFLPNEPPSLFFIYVAVLAVVSVILSKLIKAPVLTTTNTTKEHKTYSRNCMNRDFVRFLIYSLLLFMCCRMLTSFFSVYYSTDMGLGGDVGMFSLIISLATVFEWLIMFLFGKKIVKLNTKAIFVVIAVMGLLKSFLIFIVQNEYLMFTVIIFHSLFFAFLWSSATPYIKKIVPENGLASAQGIWVIVTSGIAPLIGSYFGGLFAEAFGIRLLFLLNACIFLLLAFATPFLIKTTAISD